MKFCDNCQNILTKNTNDYVLNFICSTCYKQYDAEPVDTLMLSVNLKEEWVLNKYKDYIQLLAKNDPVNPNHKVKCQRIKPVKCDNDIAKVLRITEDNSNIHFYVCTKCNYKFK